MDDLMAALSATGKVRVETVSDTFAEDGLVRLVVRSDASVTVEIDPFAAEAVPVSDIERHIRELFEAASIPDPSKPGAGRPEPRFPGDPTAMPPGVTEERPPGRYTRRD